MINDIWALTKWIIEWGIKAITLDFPLFNLIGLPGKIATYGAIILAVGKLTMKYFDRE